MSAVEYIYPVERWREYSYAFQVSNIGTELGRAIECKKKHKYESMFNYLHEVMWQISYTLKDSKNENKFDSYLYEYAEEASTNKTKEE